MSMMEHQPVVPMVGPPDDDGDDGDHNSDGCDMVGSYGDANHNSSDTAP